MNQEEGYFNIWKKYENISSLLRRWSLPNRPCLKIRSGSKPNFEPPLRIAKLNHSLEYCYGIPVVCLCLKLYSGSKPKFEPLEIWEMTSTICGTFRHISMLEYTNI